MDAQLQLIQKHMDDRFNKLESMLGEVAGQGINNNRDLARFEERLKSGAENFTRNEKQHGEFYEKINCLEKRSDTLQGSLKVINIIVISLLLPLIIVLVRSFL